MVRRKMETLFGSCIRIYMNNCEQRAFLLVWYNGLAKGYNLKYIIYRLHSPHISFYFILDKNCHTAMYSKYPCTYSAHTQRAMICDQRTFQMVESESRTSFMLRRMPQSHCQQCVHHYDFQLAFWYENQFQIIHPNMHQCCIEQINTNTHTHTLKSKRTIKYQFQLLENVEHHAPNGTEKVTNLLSLNCLK